jgi:hypothetical protein
VQTRLRDGAVLSVVKLLTWVSKPIGWGIVDLFEPALAFPELLQQDPFAREHEHDCPMMQGEGRITTRVH